MSNLNNNRFVILYHEIPANGPNGQKVPNLPEGTSAEDYANRRSHWDFMLADGDHLLTWAVEKRPEPGSTSPATQLANHRLAYLDFEGEISGGRGCVTRLVGGTFEWIERTKDRFVVVLECEDSLSKVELIRMPVVDSDSETFEFKFH